MITGCAHAGLVNILRHSTQLTGVEKIEGIVGRLHLVDASDQRIRGTVDVIEIDPPWVVTGHCTDTVPSRLGPSFDLLHSGARIAVEATPARPKGS